MPAELVKTASSLNLEKVMQISENLQSPERQELNLSGGSDDLFDSALAPKPFCFNEQVAAVFDDMISRSVPLYKDAIKALGIWTQSYYRPSTKIFDLGCSTGTTMEYLARQLRQSASFVGIDNSAPMLERARLKLEPYQEHDFDFFCSDLSDTKILNASVVVMNYTMQFLPLNDRAKMLTKIHAGLNPGGLFFMSEKIRSEHTPIEQISTAIYEQFKQDNGYSRTAIERKKEALDKVLVPCSLKEKIAMIEQAGFEKVQTILQWHNFVSIVAIKAN